VFLFHPAQSSAEKLPGDFMKGRGTHKLRWIFSPGTFSKAQSLFSIWPPSKQWFLLLSTLRQRAIALCPKPAF
jgi:hypothetical protein